MVYSLRQGHHIAELRLLVVCKEYCVFELSKKVNESIDFKLQIQEAFLSVTEDMFRNKRAEVRRCLEMFRVTYGDNVEVQ
jgi:hypothetical protein